MNRTAKKTNIKEIQVKTVNRPLQINRLPTHRQQQPSSDVSVEKFLKDFKSEKSQARSERSVDSHNSTHMNRLSNLTFESYTNRYNNSSVVKTLTCSQGSQGKQPQFPTQCFKVNIPIKKPQHNHSTDRLQKTVPIIPVESSNAVYTKILGVLDRFSDEIPRLSFERLLERIVTLNQILNESGKNLNNSVHKQIIIKFQEIMTEIGKKSLLRLSEKEDEVETAAEQQAKSILSQAQQDIKVKYERKIGKLMQIIQQKEQKEREVNKLVYYLRKSGVDIEGIWNKHNIEKHKKCRTSYQ